MKKKLHLGLLLLGISFVFGLGYNGEAATTKPQGNYISDGSYVQITKKNYDTWQNFSWKKRGNTANMYQKTFQAKGRYQHRNGATYYSLFDSNNKWQGYLNATATTKVGKQGKFISDGSYVRIIRNNYDTWQNFNWKKKNKTNNIYNQTLQARGRYQHFNGATYYSLYDNKGTWFGYLNATATTKTTPQGNFIADGRYVKITKPNYDIWQNFNWKKKNNTNSFCNQSLEARGQYKHFNGETYYSLYNDKNTWIGYLNTKATENYLPQKKIINKTINKDTNNAVLNSTSGYSYVSETKDNGVITATYPNGDTQVTVTITKIWKKNVTKNDFSNLKEKTPTYSKSMTEKIEKAVNNFRVQNGEKSLPIKERSRKFSNDNAKENINDNYMNWSANHNENAIGTTFSIIGATSEDAAVQKAFENWRTSPNHHDAMLWDDNAEIGASVYVMKTTKNQTTIYTFEFIVTMCSN